MNSTAFKNFVITLATAAILGQAAFSWSVNARLARIETILQIKTGINIADK